MANQPPCHDPSPTDVSRARRRRHHPRRARMSTVLCFESAQLAKVQIAPHLKPTVERRAARKYMHSRTALSVIAVAAPLLHSLFGEWRFIFSFGTLPGYFRLYAYFFSLYIPTLLIAAAFPSDVTTEAGAKFAFVPVVVCSCLRCVGVCLDLYHTGTHVNVACAFVHRCTAVLLLFVWGTAAVQGIRHRMSWGCARCIHGSEGTILLTCTIALRICGPPPVYPPGDMPFPASLARGGLAVALASVILHPAMRKKIAAIANRLGFNHLTIHLGELRAEARQTAQGISLLTCSSSCSLTQSEPEVGSNACSHHTTKLEELQPAATAFPAPCQIGGGTHDHVE